MPTAMVLICIICIVLVISLTNGVATSPSEVSEGTCLTKNNSIVLKSKQRGGESASECYIAIVPQSKAYFKSRIIWAKPRLIRFTIDFIRASDGADMSVGFTDDVVWPFTWVWTYQAREGYYPYLSWNIDYGVLSFGLLDADTLGTKPNVRLNVSGDCNITLGSLNTTKAIVRAMTEMTATFDENSTYDNSYYCFLARNPHIQNTFEYSAAVYLLLPISYINYNCCKTCHNYIKDSFEFNCYQHQIEKWSQCLIGPYIFGIIIFLYFPKYLFKFAKHLSGTEAMSNMHQIVNEERKDDFQARRHSDSITLNNEEREDHLNVQWHSNSITLNKEEREDNLQPRWHSDSITLDGSSPYPFSKLFSTLWCGLDKKNPTLASKLRRFIIICLTPVIIYAQILLYKILSPDLIKEVLRFDSPVGFLSLLGDSGDARRVFATTLGGPVSLLVAFHVLGFTLLVLPKSLQQVVENGIPKYTKAVSPLCLGINDVRKLSLIPANPKPGYDSGAALCRCGMYLIFSKSFWAKVLEIQKSRIANLCKGRSKLVKVCGAVLIMPVYATICILECFLCVLYYGIPFCVFVSILVSGACRSLISNTQLHTICLNPLYSSQSVVRKVFINILFFIGALIVSATILYFAYATGLIFIESFYFLAEIAVFAFVSVIIFPNVAFGYLFFFLVLMYYLARLIRDFSDGYLELLSDIVDISKTLTDERCDRPKLRLENDYYVIPKPLFDYIVQKHRPVHQQLLRVILHVIFILTLIAATLSIITKYVTGPTTEISEVMHILFIVIVGAIPRVLEFAFVSANHSVARGIQVRQLRRSVREFWDTRSHDVY